MKTKDNTEDDTDEDDNNDDDNEYQSINQSKFYSTNICGVAKLSGANPNQCSTAKSMKQFHNVNRSSSMPLSMRDRPGQKDMSWDNSW